MNLLSRQRRFLVLLWAVVAAYLGYIGWTHVEGFRAAQRGEMPLYTDYTSTYAASLLVREIPAENLYFPKIYWRAEVEATRKMYPGISDWQAHGVGFSPFMYPPTFIFLVVPLAYLPYFLSWVFWLSATAVPYVAAMRRILPSPYALPLALAGPPAFFNMMFGQTGFLSAGLIGLGLALLGARPILAGVLIGLASVKPHLGLLLPFALAAGGHWRPFGAAAMTVIGLIVASVGCFGDDPWFGFIGTFLFHLQGFDHGAYDYRQMTTVLAAAVMSGLSLDTAWMIQNLVTVAMVLLVMWAWRRGRKRPDLLGLQAALLCAATALALPALYLYDLVLLMPAAAWLWSDFRDHGARRWEYVGLMGSLAGLMPLKWIAQAFNLQLGPLLVAGLLALALLRYRTALASPPPASAG